MPLSPKPKKSDRLDEKRTSHVALAAYRQQQSKLAILRDDDWCIFCWFRFGRRRRRQEIHHVYGRGKAAGDWRESHVNLACTCKDCHPLPIQTPGANDALAWVEDCLCKANANPLNTAFTDRLGERHWLTVL